jgi:hypothetical protein
VCAAETRYSEKKKSAFERKSEMKNEGGQEAG